MIIDAIFVVVGAVVEILYRVLPEPSALPEQINTAFAWLGSTIGQFDFFVPLDTLFTVLGIVIAVEAAVLTWTIADGIYRRIRG